MLECVCFAREQRRTEGFRLGSNIQDGGKNGVKESPVIGPASPQEGMAAGKLDWPHGFSLRRLDLESGAETGLHSRQEAEVLYLHQGHLDFEWEEGELSLEAGDVLTVPIQLMHSYRNRGNDSAVAYVIRGQEQPAACQWQQVHD